MAGIPGGVNQAAQVAQQAQKVSEQAPKTGSSKFDNAMANKAEAAQQTNQVNKTQATQQVQQTQKADHVNQVQKSGKADELKQVNANKRGEPVGQKAGADKARSKVENLLTQIESRNASMDKFINQAMSGKVKLNQQQLLGLQAKVAEYSLELDLTGKVVEKATNGLKDTLRTQV
jgi:hypothetical protein